MKYKLIKELYDCFYTPPELSAPRQEIEDCHKALIEVLEKPERNSNEDHYRTGNRRQTAEYA